jgi:hypothetical protein
VGASVYPENSHPFAGHIEGPPTCSNDDQIKALHVDNSCGSEQMKLAVASRSEEL